MMMAQQVLVAEAGMIRTGKMGKLAYKNETRLESPTRFLVHSSFCDEFGSELAKHTQGLKVRDGLKEGTRMGSLVNPRRVSSMIELTQDVVDRGGVNDLAYGSEGGPEALDVYLNTRSGLIHND